jgi:hypothetical protein
MSGLGAALFFDRFDERAFAIGNPRLGQWYCTVQYSQGLTSKSVRAGGCRYPFCYEGMVCRFGKTVAGTPR